MFTGAAGTLERGKEDTSEEMTEEVFAAGAGLAVTERRRLSRRASRLLI